MIDLVVRAPVRDLGGFAVRRALPSAKRRLVGPFIFFDHMGPVTLTPGHGIDVRPHPHINLATVTFLFDGELVHRDSLGTEQTIRPGAVNWMTAGRGIVHSERSGPDARRTGAVLHGIQLWVALPSDQEEVPPAFDHYPSEAIPSVVVDGVTVRVIVGSALGVSSPVKIRSPMMYLEARLPRGTSLRVPEMFPERAAYVVAGAVRCDGETFDAGTMLIFASGAWPVIEALEDAHVMYIAGEPLDGPRHIEWNFVSSDASRIERAKNDWKNGRFPKVPGDDFEFIPLPER